MRFLENRFNNSRLIVVLTVFLFSACGGDTNGTNIPTQDTGKADTGTVDTGVLPDSLAPDNRVVDLGTPDSGPSIDQGTTDFGNNIPEHLLACGMNAQSSTGTLTIGAKCTDHGQCSTGYCYNEWYMGWGGGFRFCTVACNGCTDALNSCSDFVEPGGPDLTCLVVRTGCHSTNFGDFDIDGFCVPRCDGLSDCNSAFGAGTYWACEAPSTNECGSIGASLKSCFNAQP